MAEEAKWYIVHTYSGYENKVKANIEKSVENSTTVSKIRLLNEEESINELSRMLGGVEITDKVRESAREMRELARQKKA